MTRYLLTVLGIMTFLMVIACDSGLSGQAIGEKTAALESAEEELSGVSRVIEYMGTVNSRSASFEDALGQMNNELTDFESLAHRLRDENLDNPDVLDQIMHLERVVAEDINVGGKFVSLTEDWDEKVGILLQLSGQHLTYVVSIIRGEEASEGSGPVTEAEISALIGHLDGFDTELVGLRADMGEIRRQLEEIDAETPEPVQGLACPMEDTAILFSSSSGSADHHISKVDSDCGTPHQRLTDYPSGHMDWSPDGTKVA